MSAANINDTLEAADHDANEIEDVNESDDNGNKIDNNVDDGAVNYSLLVSRNIIGDTSSRHLKNGSVGANIIY
jgi:hypothetical protein